MNTRRRVGDIVAVLAVGVLVGGANGCERSSEAASAGPAESAGRQLDLAGAEVGRQVTEAAEAADEGLRRAAQETGDGVRTAAEAAKSGLDDATVEVGTKIERVGEQVRESAQE